MLVSASNLLPYGSLALTATSTHTCAHRGHKYQSTATQATVIPHGQGKQMGALLPQQGMEHPGCAECGVGSSSQ